jgi:hypothetical protein
LLCCGFWTSLESRLALGKCCVCVGGGGEGGKMGGDHSPREDDARQTKNFTKRGQSACAHKGQKESGRETRETAANIAAHLSRALRVCGSVCLRPCLCFAYGLVCVLVRAQSSKKEPRTAAAAASQPASNVGQSRRECALFCFCFGGKRPLWGV